MLEAGHQQMVSYAGFAKAVSAAALILIGTVWKHGKPHLIDCHKPAVACSCSVLSRYSRDTKNVQMWLRIKFWVARIPVRLEGQMQASTRRASGHVI